MFITLGTFCLMWVWKSNKLLQCIFFLCPAFLFVLKLIYNFTYPIPVLYESNNAFKWFSVTSKIK